MAAERLQHEAEEPMPESLQDTYAPNNRCFGCGPANEKGLRIKSRVDGDRVVADFTPEQHHQAFEGMVNGGIIGALLDCHSNWTAAHALMLARGAETPPCTVTAEFHVKLMAVTPLGPTLHLVARPTEIGKSRVVVEAELSAEGAVTATCRGVFVAVKEGHPAYHRW
jgi:acyl-coenzyme A thioesterase PaaI-like protein